MGGGEKNAEGDAIMKEYLDTQWNESKGAIEYDTTNVGEVIDVYNNMIAARDAMEAKYSAEDLKKIDHYRELNREIKEMAESMPDVIAA
jgi:hypothetical protein